MLLAFIIGKLNRMEEIFMRTVTETYNVYTYPELSETKHIVEIHSKIFGTL